ncbi:MAG: MotA/TolQ/ExbB proton channel family protein [Verrucomicrobiae bacterium]|nr:MotA/TolQ/ExbB proton channel family protein [Verrucomicrobiae bacterium]
MLFTVLPAVLAAEAEKGALWYFRQMDSAGMAVAAVLVICSFIGWGAMIQKWSDVQELRRRNHGFDRRLRDQHSVIALNFPGSGNLCPYEGVMVTFGALTEKASIAQLAPGVCGALVTTTLGLLVAIPATFGYNYLLTQVKIMSTELENFASTLADRVELELEAEARLNFEQQQQRELLRRAAAQAAVVSAPASVAPMAAAEPATPGELPGWEDAQ